MAVDALTLDVFEYAGIIDTLVIERLVASLAANDCFFPGTRILCDGVADASHAVHGVTKSRWWW